ncbi:carboxymuconolactone decarboxylase family protein [Nocardioides daejeonensis]|uniref:carboxymuconolactone decarboxylase family protein n=1 Tax=Nocardioides daejeonensis TaxID=1046556 RepID=UPI001EF54CC4|nr:carboxymuconolactone decarboxylase family protein [Nocardioides daejeonensis]
MTDRGREIAILMVAVATASDFEWYAHERVGLAVGLSEAELAALTRRSAGPRPGSRLSTRVIWPAPWCWSASRLRR